MTYGLKYTIAQYDIHFAKTTVQKTSMQNNVPLNFWFASRWAMSEFIQSKQCSPKENVAPVNDHRGKVSPPNKLDS